ncbi:hypothetical protein PanWU01x14_035400, partial [Parasponia andersonii]
NAYNQVPQSLVKWGKDNLKNLWNQKSKEPPKTLSHKDSTLPSKSSNTIIPFQPQRRTNGPHSTTTTSYPHNNENYHQTETVLSMARPNARRAKLLEYYGPKPLANKQCIKR